MDTKSSSELITLFLIVVVTGTCGEDPLERKTRALANIRAISIWERESRADHLWCKPLSPTPAGKPWQFPRLSEKVTWPLELRIVADRSGKLHEQYEVRLDPIGEFRTTLGKLTGDKSGGIPISQIRIPVWCDIVVTGVFSKNDQISEIGLRLELTKTGDIVEEPIKDRSIPPL
jgi:hypothetical protein